MVNKLLFAGALLALGGGGLVYFVTHGSEPTSELIALGFGQPNDSGVPMEVVVGITMPKIDPPKLKGMVIDWEGWINNHFECKDESGAAVFFRKVGFSKSIPTQVAGVEEFFIMGYVKPGAKYVFEYIPILSEPKRYRHEFTAPTGAKEGERIAFAEVE